MWCAPCCVVCCLCVCVYTAVFDNCDSESDMCDALTENGNELHRKGELSIKCRDETKLYCFVYINIYIYVELYK